MSEPKDTSSEIALTPDFTPRFNGDLYAALGLDQNKVFSTNDIVKAYRRLIGKYHPDRVKQTEQSAKELKQIQQAYDVLSKEESRKFYDDTGVLPFTQVEIEKNGDNLTADRLLSVCQELCGDSNSITPEGLAKLDIVAQAERTFHNDLQRNTQIQNNVNKVIKKLKVVIKRMSKKTGNFHRSPVGSN
jgi:DnaJ-class molecular chaperone